MPRSRKDKGPQGFAESPSPAYAAPAEPPAEAGLPDLAAAAAAVVPFPRAMPDALAGLSQHGYSEDEIFKLVIPKRTLARRRVANEPLTVDETDKALRLERVAVHAERVFGAPDKAHRWLRKPKRRLNGATPVDFLASEVGARKIEQWLNQIDHGMFA